MEEKKTIGAVIELPEPTYKDLYSQFYKIKGGKTTRFNDWLRDKLLIGLKMQGFKIETNETDSDR